MGQGLQLKYIMPEFVFKGDFDTVRFALRLSRKDIALATEFARELNVPLKIGNIAEQELVEAISRGWDERDHWAPFTL